MTGGFNHHLNSLTVDVFRETENGDFQIALFRIPVFIEIVLIVTPFIVEIFVELIVLEEIVQIVEIEMNVDITVKVDRIPVSIQKHMMQPSPQLSKMPSC